MREPPNLGVLVKSLVEQITHEQPIGQRCHETPDQHRQCRVNPIHLGCSSPPRTLKESRFWYNSEDIVMVSERLSASSQARAARLIAGDRYAELQDSGNSFPTSFLRP